MFTACNKTYCEKHHNLFHDDEKVKRCWILYKIRCKKTHQAKNLHWNIYSVYDINSCEMLKIQFSQQHIRTVKCKEFIPGVVTLKTGKAILLHFLKLMMESLRSSKAININGVGLCTNLKEQRPKPSPAPHHRSLCQWRHKPGRTRRGFVLNWAPKTSPLRCWQSGRDWFCQ